MLSQTDPTTGLTELQEALAQWSTADLMTYAMAIGLMFQQVETYAADQPDGTPGWSTMLDVDTCPTGGLPYLGQWVGARVPDGLSDADQRDWIRTNARLERGTPESVAQASQRWLTGNQVVQINERKDGAGNTNIDKISIAVFASQCPSPSLVQGELRRTVPADVQYDFTLMTEQTWSSVKTEYPTGWGAVKAANASWAQLQGQTQGWLSWDNPPT